MPPIDPDLKDWLSGLHRESRAGHPLEVMI
jgi:hypothetical protein